MRTIILMLFSVFFLLITSCDNSSEFLNNSENQVEVSFTGEIEGMTTRGHRTSFQESDRIGVYAFAGQQTQRLNVPYIYGSDNRFTSLSDEPIYFHSATNENAYGAYYPYSINEDIISNKIYFRAVDQSPAAQGRLDRLYAHSGSSGLRSSEVNLTFKHMMCKLTLVIRPGNGFTLDEIISSFPVLMLSGLIYDGEFDLINGVAQAVARAGRMDNVNFMSAVPHDTHESRTYSLYMVPQHLNSFEIVIVLNGERYALTVNVPADEDGEHKISAGKNYIFNLIIDRSKVDLDDSEIVNWNNINTGDYHVNR